MYTSMKDLHKAQVRQRHEEHEVEDGFRALKGMRLQATFATRAKHLQHYHDERRKRWRANGLL